MEVPEDLFAAPVPSLILQPIAENAIKHGIARVATADEFGSPPFGERPAEPERLERWTGVVHGLGKLSIRHWHHQSEQPLCAPCSGTPSSSSLRNEASGVEVLLSVPFREKKS